MHRVEDFRLLTGQGRFTDDIVPADALHAAFVRTPLAHAEIKSIETSAAMALPGARAVLTGADVTAAGMQPLPVPDRLKDSQGRGPTRSPWHALAIDRVRHVGETVAFCIADNRAAAIDMAEAVAVEYAELPAVISVENAAKPGAFQLWEQAPGNLAFHYTIGDAAAVEAAMTKAAHVVTVSLTSQRLVPAPMEPRAAIAKFEATTGTYHLHAGNQGSAFLRAQIAAVLAVPEDKVVVTAGDVGGGFGIRGSSYPEYSALLLAARKLGRSIHWTQTRSEGFVSDNQARDSRMTGRLALDANGRILAFDGQAIADMGAYMQPAGYYIACANFVVCLTGPYHMPAFSAGVRCLHTNTATTAPYRGAGRPEAAYLTESLMDAAAAKLGLDRIEIRRRNMLTRTELPHKTLAGAAYDTGDFPAVLDAALHAGDWTGAERRKATSRAKGKLRGIGIGCFVEIAGGTPTERAELKLEDDGTVRLRTPLGATGQGHQTVFALLAAEQLGIPPEQIKVQTADSRGFVDGNASFASRSTTVAGAAIRAAALKVLAQARARAGERLQTDPAALVYQAGRFTVPGTGQSLTFSELAGDGEPEIIANERVETPPTFPNGAHVAEVEIDPETGFVALERYTAVDDCGRVIAPPFAEGQVHGAIAQGAGQVLTENAVYDAHSGQLLTGSFMDYAMPRADDVPQFSALFLPAPATTNPIGTKGVGEAGTTAAVPAIASAILDALGPLGVRELHLPATPDRVWALIQAAGTGRAPVAGQAIGAV